jgi:linearmycin/streptolysin S transport system permease protein
MNEFLLILLPGTMYFWVLFIGQGPMQEVLQDKDNHILPRILAAPVTLRQFVLSKMLRCFLLCALALLLLVLVSALLFGIHWGNPPMVAVVIAACALSMTGLLALVYSLARTREQANVMSSLILLVFAMVGGSMFPYESLPGFLQAVGQFTPNRWGVLALRAVAGSKPLAELLKPLTGLVALGALGCGFAFVLF